MSPRAIVGAESDVRAQYRARASKEIFEILPPDAVWELVNS